MSGMIDEAIDAVVDQLLTGGEPLSVEAENGGADVSALAFETLLKKGEYAFENSRDPLRAAIQKLLEESTAQTVGLQGEALQKHYELVQNGEEGPDIQSFLSGEGENLLSELVDPELDFVKLEKMVDKSPILKACIDAIVTNTNFGYDIKPVWDIQRKKMIDANGQERMATINRKTGEEIDPDILAAMDEEYNRLSMFHSGACLDMSWEQLCNIRSINEETFGCAFWEWEVDETNAYIGVKPVDTKTVRLLKPERFPITVKQKVKNPITMEYEERTRKMRFRRFVQIVGTQRVYFKEFRDPRVMDARTGKYLRWPGSDAFGAQAGAYVLREEYLRPESQGGFPEAWLPKGFIEATELLHFKIYHPGSPYGIPRYVPSTKIVLGVHLADMVNFHLLNGNAIPPVMVIVEGTRDQQLQKMITEHVDKTIRGPHSFSKMLVVQVDSKLKGTSSGLGSNVIKPTVKVIKLADVIMGQGMFLEYTKLQEERTISNYRLPNLFVGKNNDMTRATAQVSKEIAEEQVFGPLRKAFDAIMNTVIYNALGIRFWRYESKASKLEDHEVRARLIEIFSRWGGLLPIDLRREASKLLDENLQDIPEPFMNKPIDISKAEVRSGGRLRNDPERLPGAPDPDPEPDPLEQPAVQPVSKAMPMLDITESAVGQQLLHKMQRSGDEVRLFIYDHAAATAA